MGGWGGVGWGWRAYGASLMSEFIDLQTSGGSEEEEEEEDANDIRGKEKKRGYAANIISCMERTRYKYT